MRGISRKPIRFRRKASTAISFDALKIKEAELPSSIDSCARRKHGYLSKEGGEKDKSSG